MPIDEVTAQDIINILQEMMKRNIRNSAKQVYHAISKTFKYAVANSKAIRNPAATDDKGIKNLLVSIKEYGGEYTTKQDLLVMAYTFVRSINIRLALWSEIDFKSKQWTIPAKKMKTKNDFIVPLTKTVKDLLKDIQQYTSDSPYVFPSTKSKTTPMSDGAMLGAIRRMGYNTKEFTPCQQLFMI